METHRDEETKIFASLSQERVVENKLLLDLLELNGEQLTYYFEEQLVTNPFIEFDYHWLDQERLNEVKPNHSVSMEQANYLVMTPESNSQKSAVNMDSSFDQTTVDFLFEQIMLYRPTPIRDVMVKLLDFLDEDGFIVYDYKEIAQKIDQDPLVVLDALTLFKQLEPIGMGARDSRECLILQAQVDSHAPEPAVRMLEEHFDALKEEDYVEIEHRMQIDSEEVIACVNYFHTLRAKPRSINGRRNKIYQIPDLSVQVTGSEVRVRFDRQTYPKLIFKADYFEEMSIRAQKDPELQAYLAIQERHYQDLISALRMRENLLVQVTRLIVLAQKSFFVGASSHLSPLLLSDLAVNMRLSEGIVGRLVANKNLIFCSKVYPLEDFINVTAQVGRSGLSALNIRSRIEQVIANSPEGELMTNESIVERLAQDKIMISENLVARYRQRRHQ